MARLTLLSVSLLTALAVMPVVSFAQDPHFESCNANALNGILVVSGQIAGLGNQMRPPTPLHLEATATAICVDETTEPPTILGTATITESVTFPPKNGNRKYALVLNDPLVLVCNPPAEVAVVLRVHDVTHDISCTPLLTPTPEPEPEPEPEPVLQRAPQSLPE